MELVIWFLWMILDRYWQFDPSDDHNLSVGAAVNWGQRSKDASSWGDGMTCEALWTYVDRQSVTIEYNLDTRII